MSRALFWTSCFKATKTFCIRLLGFHRCLGLLPPGRGTQLLSVPDGLVTETGGIEVLAQAPSTSAAALARLGVRHERRPKEGVMVTVLS
ncbi:hypothetical protein D9600_06340 [Deinococcus sp. DB0503]|nr:hypothetical protein [Deinococcus sp. DB0503]